MKKVKIILAVILAAATMTTFSCNRDEDDTNNQNQQQQQQDPVHPTDKDLTATTWEGHIDGVYSYGYIDIDISLDVTIDFNDSLNCEMFMDMLMTFPEEMGQDPQNQNFTEEGVYYFDGQKLYIHDADDYSPYTEDDVAMTFNAADTTFYMPFNDADMEAMFNREGIVLSLTHGTINLK
ncbi:MAG: hypothetical protein K6F85_04490 [Bacteroidales bacterium]|nr:hypothetical protein [Bacteroidales bacterium]